VKLAMLRLQTLGRCRTAVRSFSTTTNWSKFWSNKWIEPEAEEIISRAYAQHQALIDHSTPQRPRVTHEELETLGAPFPSHPSPKIGDKIARNLVHGLTPFTHWFFRDKYNHHAVVLETVAAVPGFVGGMLRHFRSLRRMDRDHGWISTLLEDAENERMHLLCVRQRAPPTRSQHLDASDSTHPNGKGASCFGTRFLCSGLRCDVHYQPGHCAPFCWIPGGGGGVRVHRLSHGPRRWRSSQRVRLIPLAPAACISAVTPDAGRRLPSPSVTGVLVSRRPSAMLSSTSERMSVSTAT